MGIVGKSRYSKRRGTEGSFTIIHAYQQFRTKGHVHTVFLQVAKIKRIPCVKLEHIICQHENGNGK